MRPAAPPGKGKACARAGHAAARLRARLLGCGGRSALALLAAPMLVAAQPVVGTRQVLDFDRPESWAMARASAAGTFGGFGPAEARAAGSLTVGIELGHLPSLSTGSRRVGFDGTKLEDLDKSPLFGRLRLGIALPAGFGLELGYTPPVEIGGARAHGMVALALERALWRGEALAVGTRATWRRGSIRGDITCDARTAAEPPGSASNPFGCRSPSQDRFHDRAASLALGVAWAPAGARHVPFVAWERSRLRLATQVDAHVFAVRDRSRLQTRGWVHTGTLGVRGGWRGLDWALALQWTPLERRRSAEPHARNADLWSLRLLLQRPLSPARRVHGVQHAASDPYPFPVATPGR